MLRRLIFKLFVKSSVYFILVTASPLGNIYATISCSLWFGVPRNTSLFTHNLTTQVSQREKLLDAAVEYLAVPTLTMTYEELTSNHRAAIRKLSTFLQVIARAHSSVLLLSLLR